MSHQSPAISTQIPEQTQLWVCLDGLGHCQSPNVGGGKVNWVTAASKGPTREQGGIPWAGEGVGHPSINHY